MSAAAVPVIWRPMYLFWAMAVWEWPSWSETLRGVRPWVSIRVATVLRKMWLVRPGRPAKAKASRRSAWVLLGSRSAPAGAVSGHRGAAGQLVGLVLIDHETLARQPRDVAACPEAAGRQVEVGPVDGRALADPQRGDEHDVDEVGEIAPDGCVVVGQVGTDLACLQLGEGGRGLGVGSDRARVEHRKGSADHARGSACTSVSSWPRNAVVWRRLVGRMTCACAARSVIIAMTRVADRQGEDAANSSAGEVLGLLRAAWPDGLVNQVRQGPGLRHRDEMLGSSSERVHDASLDAGPVV